MFAVDRVFSHTNFGCDGLGCQNSLKAHIYLYIFSWIFAKHLSFINCVHVLEGIHNHIIMLHLCGKACWYSDVIHQTLYSLVISVLTTEPDVKECVLLACVQCSVVLVNQN